MNKTWPLMFLLTASLPAASIDFEELNVAFGSQINPAVGVPYDSGGFTFNSPGADMHFFGPGGLDDNGTTRLAVHGFVDFSPVGGGVFTLNSFSFDYWLQERNTVTVTGTLLGGGTVAQTFTTDGSAGGFGTSSFELFVLNGGFTNLTSVRVDSGAANSPVTNGFSLDNITVNGPSSAVPEPGTLGLLAGGLAIAALGRRKRAF